MLYGRRNKHQSVYITISVCSILLLYLIFTPIIYTQSSVIITGRNDHSISLPGMNPIRQDGKVSYITAAVTENLMLTDMVIYHLIRSGQESRQLPNLLYNALAILLSGYGILVHNSRCGKCSSNQRTCIVAGSLGGHAPPIYNI